MTTRGYLPEIVEGRGGISATGSSVVVLDGGAGGAAALIPPGPDSAAQTIAAFAAGSSTVLYEAGTYEWDRPVPMPSGTRIVGRGSDDTIIHANYAGVGADTPTNAMVLIQGTLSPAVLAPTTLAVQAKPDEEQVTVTAVVGSLAAGSWFVIDGHNNPAQEIAGISSGDDITLTEMLEVASLAGPVLSLTGPVLQNHATNNGGLGVPVTVEGVLPARDVRIEGVRFDASGGSIAVAVLCAFAEGVVIRDVSFVGFSRACIEPRLGTRNFRFERLRVLGEVNSIVLGSSCMAGVVRDVVCDADGERFHASGIPRGFFNCRNRVTNVMYQTCQLRRGCVAMRTWGGTRITFQDVWATDFDIARARAQDPEIAASIQGVGVDMGCGPLNINETSLNLHYDNVHLSNMRHQSFALNFSWWLHDTHHTLITNCSIVNDGIDPNTVGKLMSGLGVQDVSANVSDFIITGCEEGLRMTGGEMDVKFTSLSMSAIAGFGQGLVGIRVNYGPATGAPRFERVSVANYTFPVFFDAAFAASPDYSFGMSDYQQGSGVFSDVVVCKNVSATPHVAGDVAALVPGAAAGTREVTDTAGASRLGMACASSAGAGAFGLYARLPSRRAVVTVNGAVANGDVLEANAANQAVVNNAAAARTALGVALQSKAAGVGPVMVGGVD